MIAACPKCAARYRIDPGKLRPEGVRLRCSKCEAVFRVRPPADAAASARAAEPAAVAATPAAPRATAPEVPADAPLVLVGTPDASVGKVLESALAGWRMRTVVVADGVEAMLEIQRRMPAAVVLAATLPKMFGFQVCEVVKRNDSLRHIGVVLLGAIHHKDRYRRPPGELYGADAYVEEPDLPDALLPALHRLGLGQGGAAPAPRPAEVPAPAERPQAPAPRPAPAARPTPAAPAAGGPRGDGLDEARAQAERLARIIVSDIVLYNEEKFAAAVAAGNVAAAMGPDLEEGRSLFQERIDERIRGERDFLVDELVRVARARGMSG